MIVYLPVDTYCSIQHKILITDSYYKWCDTQTYGIIHKHMQIDIFISTYSQHACIRHKHIKQIHTETIVNVETHLGKTTKALFIWHEKYVSTFCLGTQLPNSSRGIFYNSYRLLSSHALRFWDYVFILFFTPLSIRTQPRSIL